MSDFDRALDSCLEALREGRWTLADCLRRYPQHADALRPQLQTVLAVQQTAGAAVASQEFASGARERFLVASGKRIEEAYGVEPSASFFAAARVRFLMAAHRMRREGTLAAKPARRRPWYVPGARALAGLAGALLIFFSFSTYTVASASSALPGDWRYPVKLETERVRLALAFNTDDKRRIQLEIAGERATEITELVKNGETIQSGELERLASQTASLTRDAQNGSWSPDALAKLQDVSEQSSIALDQAAPHVAASAAPALAHAVSTSKNALLTATVAITKQPRAGVLNPTIRITPTASPAPSETPATPAADSGSATPGASPTPTPPAERPPTPVPPAAAPPISVSTPVTSDLGVLWIRLSVRNLSALIPSEKDGWRIAGGDYASPSPTLIHLSNADSTSLIILNAMNGDMWWYQVVDGQFQETDMRVKQPDGSVLLVDPDVLRGIYGDLAAIPLYVLNSIVLTPPPVTPSAPPPTPTPGS
ncbi:MAG: hypothetical protein IVW36_09850 [Dehalococcoidia bacterium]|nr:hypothetical protein [Dehalococcoidia bacterium]